MSLPFYIVHTQYLPYTVREVSLSISASLFQLNNCVGGGGGSCQVPPPPPGQNPPPLILFSHLSIHHGRRIYTEEKAKVVAAAWGTEFIQFLAVLAIFQDLKNRMILSQDRMISAAATTFAFSSIQNLLLCFTWTIVLEIRVQKYIARCVESIMESEQGGCETAFLKFRETRNFDEINLNFAKIKSQIFAKFSRNSKLIS